MRVRHELLARHVSEQCEHARIEHLPGAHLLLDHLFAGLIHRHRSRAPDTMFNRTYCACRKGPRS